MKSWILVANASRAYLYNSDNLRTKDLQLVQKFNHPESREKALELASDRPGHYQTDHKTRSSYEKSHPKEEEAVNFAKQLALMLKEGHNNHEYEQLVIISSPHFYGLLNKNLFVKLDNMHHIAKDYTDLTLQKMKEKELRKRVLKYVYGE